VTHQAATPADPPASATAGTVAPATGEPLTGSTATTTDPAQGTTKAVPKLYWLDYLGSCAELPYAAHGYAQYYCLSILDKHHHPGLSLEQGMKVLKMCTDELKRRMPIDFKGMTVKIVTVNGVKEVPYEEDFTVKSA